MTHWTPLLVPEEDYLEFASLVALRLAQRRDRDPADGPEALRVVAPQVDDSVTATGGPAAVMARALNALRPWSVEDLRRLAKGETVTTQRWAQVLDLCSQRVGEFLSTQDVAAHTGMRVEEWRDAPRKIQRHLDRHYPNVPGWPLAAVSGRKLGHTYDQAYWAINDEQASRWMTVRGETK